MGQLSRYRKTIAAIIGAIATWVLATFPDDKAVKQWASLAVAVLTALGVFSVPNDAPAGDVPDPAVSERGLTALGVVLVIVILVLAFGLFGAFHSPLFLLLLLAILLVVLL